MVSPLPLTVGLVLVIRVDGAGRGGQVEFMLRSFSGLKLNATSICHQDQTVPIS